MLIRPLSDLHLEFDDTFVPEEIESDKDTVLILSGDIHIGIKAIPWISQFNERFKEVLYVLGNHEYYKHSFSNLIQKMNTEIERLDMKNVHILERETKVIDGVAFIGTTLWTDFDKGNPVAMLDAGMYMNDYKSIRVGEGNPYQRKLRPFETAAVHNESVFFIKEELKKDYEKRVVITHHLPSYKFISSEYSGSLLNHAYASNLDDLIVDNDIDVWIFGHSHSARVEHHSDTLFVQNCRGYDKVETVKGFNKKLIIEI